jgi:leucyl-tRNA synthetase
MQNPADGSSANCYRVRVDLQWCLPCSGDTAWGDENTLARSGYAPGFDSIKGFSAAPRVCANLGAGKCLFSAPDLPIMTPTPTYQPRALESAIQKAWSDADVYRAREHDPRFPKGKFYCVSMLPYPSGKLHMGHVRNYTINDVMARRARMLGHNVLMPMGWDAFGLPAENAAIKNKVPPARWTYDNIAYMKQQMQAMGLSIDWSREVATCDPAYYRWNQWFFLKMYEKGIAYRKTQVVNWDPVDQTVLANEQVIDGRGWRTGAPVEKREIPGYYLGITRYAPELLSYLDNMQGWPERVRTMQVNWIGKSEGVRFAFTHALSDSSGALLGDGKLHVFTTRADTIMGVTFCAVAPEHPVASLAAIGRPDIAAFIAECQQATTMEADLATMEKKGVATGLFVTHPLTGKGIPVWIGNYVLMGYGDGAVMGVPAHDERDFAFAKKYGLDIVPVIAKAGSPAYDGTRWHDHYADKVETQCVNSGAYDGLGYQAAVDAVARDLAAKGLAEKRTTFRLRDWGISRQRYWGTPIPIIHCPDCGEVPVPESDLPVVLPEDCVPDGSGNPLRLREDFLRCTCPQCGSEARRETDTMDTFIDSSWYFMRYTGPDATTMVDARNDYWMPMDQYIGGIEHAILHLLYARFWTKVMRDLGLGKVHEPADRLLCQGMVLNHIFSRRKENGGIEYFPPADVDFVHDEEGHVVGGRLHADGSAVDYGGVGTMSKSKLNGVDPQDIIDAYGADTARLFVMFTSHPEYTLEWSDKGVQGSHRFLRKLWDFGHQVAPLVQSGLAESALGMTDPVAKAIRLAVHTILKQANYDFDRIQYNTVVSAGMKLIHALEDASQQSASTARDTALAEGMSITLRVLYPIIPHVAQHLWAVTGCEARWGALLDAPWPLVDPVALEADEIELMIQVNGKLRGSFKVPSKADKATIEALARGDATVIKQVGDGAIKKLIVVPGRLVNVVM